MDKAIEQLVEKLRKAYDDRLVSVVLYGSAVSGDRNEGFSDYNVLCILTEVTPRELASATEIFRWWREKGNPSPLLLAEREITRGADCFPIEFRDIQREHQVLHGTDPIADLVVDDVFYRAQVEHDLRSKLLRLRQKAGGMLSDSDLLCRLLADSISTFCVLFRHALVLHGVDAPLQKREVVRAAAARFEIDPAPFEQLLDVRERRLKPRDVRPIELLGSSMAQIERVIEAVDSLAK
jgi:predicted nucleotidyltransferase